MLTVLLAAAACHIGGTPPFYEPDPACTPGAFAPLTIAESCRHKTRPPLADRQRIVDAYGVPDWSGRNGELDHRVPFFLGGTTDRRNIWPEPGRIPNTKDRLEFYVYDRVCRRSPHPMRATTARRIFLGDWVVAFRKYGL